MKLFTNLTNKQLKKNQTNKQDMVLKYVLPVYIKNKCNQLNYFDGVFISLKCAFTVGSNGEVWMDTTPIKQKVKAGDTTVLGCSVEKLGGNVV